MSSVPTRRNGTHSTTKTTFTPPKTHSEPSTTRTPLLPTPLEALLLAIYPSTLLLGSLFSLLEPNARNAPYSTTSQSHPSDLAPSYFAQKRNLFNVLFVKKGWFWTSLAYAIFLLMHPSMGPRRSLTLTPRRVQGLLRYAITTMWWAVVTQWFFGPPLIDRNFLWTGGQCDLVRSEEGRMGMSDAREFLTAAACKMAGGKWKGGHDISGHVFLLILGSAFLWLEILPVVMRYAGLREERLIRAGGGEVVSAEKEVVERRAGDGEEEGKGTSGVSAPVAVTALSWWMLLMTAAYFHTWFEKFTGLVVAFTGIFVVYFLPRAVPGMRAVVGIPGV